MNVLSMNLVLFRYRCWPFLHLLKYSTLSESASLLFKEKANYVNMERFKYVLTTYPTFKFSYMMGCGGDSNLPKPMCDDQLAIINVQCVINHGCQSMFEAEPRWHKRMYVARWNLDVVKVLFLRLSRDSIHGEFCHHAMFTYTDFVLVNTYIYM